MTSRRVLGGSPRSLPTPSDALHGMFASHDTFGTLR